jgi:hypothetical protein
MSNIYTDKRLLSETEFQAAIEGKNISEQNRDIAYGVFVLGLKQSAFVQKYNLSKSAVSKTCSGVWKSHLMRIGELVEVNVTIHKRDAFIVRKLEKKALGKLKRPAG